MLSLVSLVLIVKKQIVLS